VFVSIYENGSDDRTKIILRELDSELGRMEVPRLIVTSPGWMIIFFLDQDFVVQIH